MSRDFWNRGSLRSTMYLAIVGAGPVGLRKADLLQAVSSLDPTRKHFDNQLAMLKAGDFVRLEEGLGPRGQYGFYRVTAECKAPPIRGLLAMHAVQAIADCPAGVTDQVLADEMSIKPTELAWLLRRAVDLNIVQRMVMPMSHGGGAGWAMVPGADPMALLQDMRNRLDMEKSVLKVAPRPANADVPVDDASADPFEVKVDDECSFAIAHDGALVIDSGGVRMALAPRHVGALLGHLYAVGGAVITAAALGKLSP